MKIAANTFVPLTFQLTLALGLIAPTLTEPALAQCGDPAYSSYNSAPSRLQANPCGQYRMVYATPSGNDYRAQPSGNVAAYAHPLPRNPRPRPAMYATETSPTVRSYPPVVRSYSPEYRRPVNDRYADGPYVDRREVEEASRAAKGYQAAPFTCPMHREIKQAGPGKCPECGMDLVPEGQSLAHYDRPASDSRPVRERFERGPQIGLPEDEPQRGVRYRRVQDGPNVDRPQYDQLDPSERHIQGPNGPAHGLPEDDRPDAPVRRVRADKGPAADQSENDRPEPTLEDELPVPEATAVPGERPVIGRVQKAARHGLPEDNDL